MIDLAQELVAALASTETKEMLTRIIRAAVKEQLVESANAAPLDGLVNIHGAAKLLDMSEAAVRKSVDRGKIPCQRIGKRIRFRRSDLILLAERK